ncbi:uncharacterized protein EV422DRAFT_371894 [Fimicolochytrium jonesii]|uniref:uncharacterized protein n=1 Tax=Fimicolochytrium jonesii TaxID=1396493 RepID=UPI0022FE3DA6|nr:uncharacterized protein EV422DRAFT_371894 [Fimicolochytrium jonesii]KAI8815534.1 hypothetical protein EV422DRAFT_371894 [Fimicolochytrium jonesii]
MLHKSFSCKSIVYLNNPLPRFVEEPSFSPASSHSPGPMDEQEGLNVAELAKHSCRKESKFKGVPLTVLAPVLVALALVGVLLPVKLQTESVIAPLPGLVKGVRDLSSTTAIFAGPWQDFQNHSEFISTLAHLWGSFKLDAISCNSARWRSGHSNTEPLDWYTNDFGVIQIVRAPGSADVWAAISDTGSPGFQRIYALNKTTVPKTGTVKTSATGLPCYAPPWRLPTKHMILQCL